MSDAQWRSWQRRVAPWFVGTVVVLGVTSLALGLELQSVPFFLSALSVAISWHADRRAQARRRTDD